MKLQTAQMLWSGYDHRRMPLSETVLKEEHLQQYTIKELYFNGDVAADGVTRIYARLYIPTCIPTGASVVLMNDIDTPFDLTYIDLLTECGFTVLALDYGGKRPDGKFTIYPQSLDNANYLSENTDYNKYITTAKGSCWYTYASIMLRGYYYLESMPGLDSNKICFFGVRRGAFQVYKAAVIEEKAAAAVALFNSAYIPHLDLTAGEAMLYNSCIDNTTYAPFLKVPTYIVESSNNNEDSLLYINSLFLATNDKASYYVAEQSDNTLNPKQSKTLLAYMNTQCFSSKTMPTQPIIEAVCEDKQLYYKVTTFGEEIDSINLYYTYGFSKGAYRNWFKLPLVKTENNVYKAKADVYLSKEEASAYVTVNYNGGISLSSEIITKTPYLMGVSDGEIVKSRLVYEADMGTNDWMITVVGGKFGEIKMTKGANSIMGVTSSINTMTTLKIGDIHTKGDDGNLLQLLVYSPENQLITFEVTATDNDKYSVYTYSHNHTAPNEWSKITLAANSFKSETGALKTWRNAIKLTVNSQSKLLISSMLWI